MSCKLVDQYASIKKRKALAAASSKAPGPKYAKFLIPRDSVALKGHLRRSTGSLKPPEPPGPPPAVTDASSFAKAQPPMPPQQKRERHGWLMTTKDLVVAYKNREWSRFAVSGILPLFSGILPSHVPSPADLQIVSAEDSGDKSGKREAPDLTLWKTRSP